MRLGEHDLFNDNDGPVVDAVPEKIIVHENYTGRPRYSNDIAVIRLDRRVNYTGTYGRHSKTVKHKNTGTGGTESRNKHRTQTVHKGVTRYREGEKTQMSELDFRTMSDACSLFRCIENVP